MQQDEFSEILFYRVVDRKHQEVVRNRWSIFERYFNDKEDAMRPLTDADVRAMAREPTNQEAPRRSSIRRARQGSEQSDAEQEQQDPKRKRGTSAATSDGEDNNNNERPTKRKGKGKLADNEDGEAPGAAPKNKKNGRKKDTTQPPAPPDKSEVGQKSVDEAVARFRRAAAIKSKYTKAKQDSDGIEEQIVEIGKLKWANNDENLGEMRQLRKVMMDKRG